MMLRCALVVFVFALAPRAALATDSVVLDLHFDEVRDNYAPDASPSENNAVLGYKSVTDACDPQLTPDGKLGCALEFDGVDDVVEVPHNGSLEFRKGVSVEAWVYQTKRTPFARVVDYGPCFELYIHTNGIATFRLQGAEAHGVRSQEPVPLNQWVHLEGRYDGQSLTLCVDGQAVARRAYGGPIPSASQGLGIKLRIGNGRGRRAFCGKIDEVKIVNMGYRVPGLARLDSDAHTVGLWHMDGNAQDGGPNQLHGEIQGAKFVDGRLGQALEFDGKASLRVPHQPALDLQEELAIECWVRQTKRTPFARIIEKDNWVYGLWIDYRGRLDFIYTPAQGGYSHTATSGPIPLNRWVHLRAEFDGFEAVIYVDGREVIRRDVSQAERTIAASTGHLFVGNRKSGDRGFVGRIDELRLSIRVRTQRPDLALRVTPYPSKQRWTLFVDARGVRDSAVRARIEGPVGHAHGVALDRGVGVQRLDVSGLADGVHKLAVTALDAKGQALAQDVAEVNKCDRPPWLGAGAGITNDVLPPWTPMAADTAADRSTMVKCWGRAHRFKGAPWPAQIHSAGADLLVAPVALVVNGERQTGQLRVVGNAPHEVRLVGDTAKAKAQVLIEYDGMMRFDVELQAAKSAHLDIPIKAQYATLMHRPGHWFREPTCASAVPEDGWREPSTWYLWLGDEERGLCWFAEDQPAWALDSERPGIEVIPEGDVVRLRVHLIHDGTDADRSQFTWGLMATPVKPMPSDWRGWRFGTPSGPVNVGVLWSSLATSKWHSFPVPPDPDNYRGIYKKAHDEGKRIVPYTNFNMQSDTGDEWAYWGEEWNGYAGLGLAADVLVMNVVNVRCCAMTRSWCDFIAYKYQQFLEQYDSDGFYLDNSIPSVCHNPEHPESHHNRRHIFAARRLMRRIYTVTKQNDPANAMVCHMSRMVCIPVHSFCDAIVDGEQYGFLLKDTFDGHYMPLTPPARLRAEFLGVQWGLIPLFLPGLRDVGLRTPAMTREMLACFLPHGTRFWLSGSCHRPTLLKVLDAVDAVRLDEAVFVPYWRVPAWAGMAEERRVLVSAYVRDGRDAMLIVSNYNDDAQDVSLDVRLLKLRAAPTRASDPLDHADVPLAGDLLRVRVSPRDLRIVRVQ